MAFLTSKNVNYVSKGTLELCSKTPVACREGERGDGPGNPRQGASKRVKLQKLYFTKML